MAFSPYFIKKKPLREIHEEVQFSSFLSLPDSGAGISTFLHINWRVAKASTGLIPQPFWIRRYMSQTKIMSNNLNKNKIKSIVCQ
jgi:hypothetical protein